MLPLILAALVCEADRAQFLALYEENHAAMERAAMAILRDQQDAEDAMQNALCQIAKHFEKTYEIPCDRLPFWCVCIVKNESISILRRRHKVLPLEDWALTERQSGPEESVSYRTLVDLFARLPQTYRAALEMRFLLGYSNKEIAQRLCLTQTAVNTRIARGRELLKKLAQEEGIHP